MSEIINMSYVGFLVRNKNNLLLSLDFQVYLRT